MSSLDDTLEAIRRGFSAATAAQAEINARGAGPPAGFQLTEVSQQADADLARLGKSAYPHDPVYATLHHKLTHAVLDEERFRKELRRLHLAPETPDWSDLEHQTLAALHKHTDLRKAFVVVVAELYGQPAANTIVEEARAIAGPAT